MQNPAREAIVLRGHDDVIWTLGFSSDGNGWRRVVKTEQLGYGMSSNRRADCFTRTYVDY